MRFRGLQLLIVLLLGFTCQTQAQDILRMYRDQQIQEQVRRFLDSTGLGARYLPLEVLPIRDQTIHAVLEQAFPEPVKVVPELPPVFKVTDWRFVRRVERLSFSGRFGNTRWSFSGPKRLLPVDTSFTRQLRARLESRFGPPTNTVVEMDLRPGRRPGDYFQFEYWILVNDSISVRVYDPSGPGDRGIVIATDQKFRDLLPDLRTQFNAELQRVAPRPYVDYYYDAEIRQWYLTGYDGVRYFTEAIERPHLMFGRPRLDTRRPRITH